MKVKALKVFGDGKRNYTEGEIATINKTMFEKLNSTSNGILVEEVKEDSEDENTQDEETGEDEKTEEEE